MDSSEEDEEVSKFLDRIIASIKGNAEYETIRSVLQSLVERIESSTTALAFLGQYASNLEQRFDKSRKLMYFFKDDSKLHDSELATLRKAFVYLGLFETSLSNLIDLILMLFIALHHDLYGFFGKQYAKSPDNLDRISMYEKLNFLKDHDLAVISQNINRNLRNKIAHLDFIIEPNGKILVKRQRYDLEHEIASLMALILCLMQASKEAGVSKLLRKLS